MLIYPGNVILFICVFNFLILFKYLKKIDFVFSSYQSKGSRKGGYENEKIAYDVPFKNGDSCFITFFNGFTSIFVVKASKSITDNSFKMHDSYIISKTVESTG